jgi:hypothetical protein
MTQSGKYNNILEEVLKEIKDLKKGALYKCIEILEPGRARAIREAFEISPNSSLSDDFRLLNKIPPVQPIFKRIDPMSIRKLPMMEPFRRVADSWDNNFSAGLIIVIALLLIGLWRFQQSKDIIRTPRQRSADTTPLQREEPEADLCLVIPCNRITLPLRDHMHLESKLSANETATLVDNSVYFLVTASKEGSMFQFNENFKDFPEDRDLFVRFRISDGEELIRVDLKRSLSRAIDSSQGPIIIKEIGLLRDLNNLEKFHRA